MGTQQWQSQGDHKDKGDEERPCTLIQAGFSAASPVAVIRSAADLPLFRLSRQTLGTPSIRNSLSLKTPDRVVEHRVHQCDLTTHFISVVWEIIELLRQHHSSGKRPARRF